jgi:N-acetyl-1-D-myo-inositol-2-amino-2-deoxy-alpha-D-glucopyranoside deacetylase
MRRPLDDVVEALVGHIRELRPDAVVTHDAYGRFTGHPDDLRIHRVTLLAPHAAGLPHLCPHVGRPCVPPPTTT